MNIIDTLNRQRYEFLHCSLTVVFVSFKINNIFITINKFTRLLGFFEFNKILKSYSCGLYNLTNKNKTSLTAYNVISQNLTSFLIDNNIKKINLIFKSSSRIKYIFLKMLLCILYGENLITISTLYIQLKIPFNGCKQKKRRFL